MQIKKNFMNYNMGKEYKDLVVELIDEEYIFSTNYTLIDEIMCHNVFDEAEVNWICQYFLNCGDIRQMDCINEKLDDDMIQNLNREMRNIELIDVMVHYFIKENLTDKEYKIVNQLSEIIINEDVLYGTNWFKVMCDQAGYIIVVDNLKMNKLGKIYLWEDVEYYKEVL